jgi:hypothetical protein
MKNLVKAMGSAILALTVLLAMGPRAVAHWDSWDSVKSWDGVQAGRVNLVSVTAESEPGSVGKIGITTDANNSISTFYFLSPSGALVEYSVAQLRSGSRVLVSKSGYEVVKVKALSSSNQSLKLNIVYLRSVVSKSTGNRVLTVQYNPNLNQYQMLDETSRPVRSAHVATHRNLVGMAVGVASISTQQ